MYQELKKNNITIPNHMAHNLMLLHSYILVKVCIVDGYYHPFLYPDMTDMHIFYRLATTP